MEKIITSLLFIYLVLFPFGQLNRLPLRLSQAPEIRFYLTDIVLFFLLLSWGLWRFFKVKRKYQPPPLAKPIFLFSFVAAVSLIVNVPLLTGREVMVAGLYLVRWLVYSGLYFVIFDLKNQFKYLKWSNMVNYLIVLGTMMAIFGLVQYLFWPNIGALEVFGWDPHYYRLVGTFLDPGFTGIILVLTFILLIVKYWKKIAKPRIKNVPIYCVLFTIYCALALTYSRSSYLTYVVGMGTIAFLKKAYKFFIIVLLIGIVTLLILPRQPGGEGVKLERTATINARVESWNNALIIFKDHPFFGVGFNAYRYAQRDYGFLGEQWQESNAGAGADSSLLFVLATTGIIGFLTYLGIWWKILRIGNLTILASALAILIHSLFLNSLFYPWVMAWMWILLAKENK